MHNSISEGEMIMSLIKGIHHIALKCYGETEYKKTLDFYENVLQLTKVRQWSAGTMLDTGSGLMEIFNNAEDQLPQGVVRHFALATDNVDACVKAVQGAGYEVFNGPKDIVIAAEVPFPARIAFCKGPIGEEIEFFQER